MIRKLIIFSMAIILSHCGYTPLYKTNEISQSLSITIISLEGNKIFNKKLNNELSKYFKKDNKVNFDVKIKTNIGKRILSKDTKGNTTNLELIGNAIFTVIINDKENILSFSETLKIKNRNDSFEQEKYENIVIENFAKSIKQKLILELNTIKTTQ